MPEQLVTVGVCVAAVAVTEVISHTFDLWRFESSTHRAVTALLAGIAFGGLAIAVDNESIVVRFAAGAGVGIAYEAVNILVLNLWTFPGGRLLFLRNRAAIVVAAGGPWGLLPVVAPMVG